MEREGAFDSEGEASYACWACGEEVVIPIDPTMGHRQDYVEGLPGVLPAQRDPRGAGPRGRPRSLLEQPGRIAHRGGRHDRRLQEAPADHPRPLGGRRRAPLRAPHHPRLQPPRVRVGARGAVPQALRPLEAEGDHAGHEPGALRHGPDRGPLRRGRRRARLARHRGAREAAAGAAPQASDPGLRLPPQRGLGRRFWGWAADRFDGPDAFFDRLFVWNYCPLVFMEEGGKNRTPDKLLAQERDTLYEVLRRVPGRRGRGPPSPSRSSASGSSLRPAPGLALPDCDLPIGTVLHPSPASPIANRGWAPQADAQLDALGVLD